MSVVPTNSAPVTAPEGQSSEPQGQSRRRRGLETIRDMSLSMALVGAVVLAVFWMVAWQRPEVQGPIRPEVDVAGLFQQFRVSEPFPVLEPTDLPDGWTPNSAWFDPAGVNASIDGGVLHVGYVTPEGSYAEVRQTNGDPKEAVAEWVDDARSANTVDVGGRSWRVVESAETGKQGLVGEYRGTTVVVTGKAGLDELQELAASLR